MVRDTGIGIEPDVTPLLFNAFEQGHRNVTRRFGGLGLGLAITRGLVEGHGGRIWVASAGKGQGACFTVELPALPTPVEIEPAPRNGNPESCVPPLRILLVEDHSDTGRVMRRLLTGQGHSVVLATSLAEARQALAGGPFNLLISDIGLPDGTGVDLMLEIQSRGGETPPAIALTGFGMEEDVIRTREAGFAAHLTKPVDMAELAATIGRVIRQPAARQQA